MTDHRIGLVRALLFGGSALVMLGACTLASRALGHDIYQGIRSPAGQLCCGGDPVTGDCEGSYDFRVNARGDVTFWSARYKASVTVPGERVIPTQLADPLNRPLHWCGRPDATEPGGFRTICLFLSPGGS